MTIPRYSDLESAAARIAPYAVRTPFIEAPVLNARCGGRIFLKLENLQRVGAFKFRGGYNAASRIDRDRFPGGVVACSSGNHAQGISEAARLLDMPAAIVMPHDAPRIKVARTRANGAEVVLYNRQTEDREAIASALGEQRQAQFIPPYDHAHVIAGQGTAGLEMAADLEALGVSPDAVLVPSSGSGLTSGVAIAFQKHFPTAVVHPVEPVGFDRVGRSLREGERVTNERTTGTICDSLISQTVGVLNYDILSGVDAQGVTVTDPEVREAMRFAFMELKQVIEPGGAAGLAALLSGKVDARGRSICVILSGGNVDPDLFAEIIGGAHGAEPEQSRPGSTRADAFEDA